MNDDWEQFPQIEGNSSTTLESLAVILAALFAIGMVVYILSL